MSSILKMFVSLHQKPFPINTLKLTLYNTDCEELSHNLFPPHNTYGNLLLVFGHLKAFPFDHSQGITQETST